MFKYIFRDRVLRLCLILWMAWIELGLKTGHWDVVRLLTPEKEWIEHHWRLLLEVIHVEQILQQRWVINSSHDVLQEHLVLSCS